MNILAFTNDTASHLWRFDPIARRFMRKRDHEMIVVSFEQWNDETLGADLVIMEQLASPHVVDTCHNLGAKVIFEADDAFIDTYDESRENLTHLTDEQREQNIKTIQKVDALTVTSEELKENYGRFTDKPIHVLPIYMDYEYYGDVIDLKMPERNTDEIRVGWFGGKSHFEDLRMVVPAIKAVLEKYENVKFVYCGYGGTTSERISNQIQWGEDVFSEIPRDRREFHPGVPAEYWKYKHRFLDLDIGLCPLIDDEFNKHKVHTKWLEYSALRTPSVCSPTVYDKVVADGKTGFIADTTKDWEEHISHLVEHERARKNMGQAASKEVRENHNVEDYWKEWEKVYREVVG